MVVLTNLDFVFDLFNRNTTLTGRVGLWEHILDIVSQKPCWLGHGFGAVWMLDAFREDVRLGIGWASQPLIGDNGFIDILLHLGIVGLMMFAGLLVTAFIRAIKYAVSHKTLADFSHYCF